MKVYKHFLYNLIRNIVAFFVYETFFKSDFLKFFTILKKEVLI